MELNLDINKESNLIREKINSELLQKYGEKAAQMAVTPISMSDSSILMDVEEEMCLEILNTWEIEKYNTNAQEILDKTILLNKDKFIYKMLLGKILRLIPMGVTILSVGINASLARRFTQALGYAMSELCLSYIKLSNENKEVDPLNIFTKDSIEDLIESYLVEYNKTVNN